MTRRKDLPDKICATCGASFGRNRFSSGVLEKVSAFNKRATCSNICWRAYESKVRGGIKTRNGFTSQLRARMCMVFCSVCRSTENLDFHHKNRDWSDNSPENIQVLCRKCHFAEHKQELRSWHFRKNKGPCTHCHRKAIAVGMCLMHWKRWKKHGTADDNARSRGHEVDHDPAPDRTKPRRR